MNRRGHIGSGEGTETLHGLLEGDDRAGEDALVRGADSVLNVNTRYTERVDAIRHSGGLERVCDQDGLCRPLGFEPKPDRLRRNVDAVTDQVSVESVFVEHHTEDARFTVVVWPH